MTYRLEDINRDFLASEDTWNERRSQFSKVFETAIQDIEIWKTNTLPGDTKRRK